MSPSSPSAATPPPDSAWERHAIADSELAVDVYRAWPTSFVALPDRKVFFQPIDGAEGSVFVSWGRGATIDAVLGPMAGSQQRVQVLSDTSTLHRERAARRVTAFVFREPQRVAFEDPVRGIVDQELLEERDQLELIGFETQRGRVLTGFRLPHELVQKYAPVLERIIGSVDER